MDSRRCGCVLVVAAVLAFATRSSAEPSAVEKETARSLMADGRAYRERGDLQGALRAFAAADAIMHVPTTELELARAQAALGLLVEARDSALRAMRSPTNSADPAPFKRARAAASALSDELGSRIPSITVTLEGMPTGAVPSVRIDSAPLAPELLGESLKLDPGHHVIVATVGKMERKVEIDIPEKDDEPVTLEFRPQETPPALDAPEENGGVPPAPALERSPASAAMIYGGFALATGGAVAGTITGVLSLSKVSSIRGSSACVGDRCSSTLQNDIAWAKGMANISTLSFVVGGVGAIVGVVGFMTGPTSGSAPDPLARRRYDARIEPWLGAGSIGIRGGF
jgi:hypothetical protein